MAVENIREIDLKMIQNFEKWSNPIRGLHRFVIASGSCYEIHLLVHKHGTDIIDADAALYIAGDWTFVDGRDAYTREKLFEGTVKECVKKAFEDFRDNCE